MSVTAGRVLHLCYCCPDADRSAAQLAGALGLREVMRTDGSPNSGDLFGMPGEIRSMAVFLYDHRGPRVAPAIEVQGWFEPPIVGQPFSEAHEVGIQAIGVRVPDPAAAVAGLVAVGGVAVQHLPDTVSVRTPDGHIIDLLSSGGADSEIVHLRVTCTDLAVSAAWYERLGFSSTGADDVVTPAFKLRRLRLPEEPLELLLTEWTDPPSTGRHYGVANHAGYYRVALRVDDTRAAYAGFVADGWLFDGPPLAVAMPGTPVPDLWIAFTRDPDGVPYELVQRPLIHFR